MRVSQPDPAASTAGVTVVVPVYNPSQYINRTISSLLEQTMPRSRYEVVFVDDGSTDGTGARLDELADAHPEFMRVVHREASGGPGGPRNLGTDLARHDWVFYCDADDWLPPDALATMVEQAERDGCDILIAKSIGTRRTHPLALFDGGDRCTTLAETPGIFTTLTCQKLFRRQFLLEARIRFPEGRVRLEDYIFMTEAYLRAGRISILASRACYVFEARQDGGNITATQADPVARLDSVRRLIDIVETYTAADDDTRAVALARVVHSGMLSVVGGPSFLRRPPDERAMIFDAIAHLLRTRIPAAVIARTGARNRRVLQALLAGDRVLLERWVAWERGVRATAQAVEVAVVGDRVHLEFAVALTEDDRPVRLDRQDDRVMLQRSAGSAGYDVTDDVRRCTVHVTLRNAKTTENWRLPTQLQALSDPEDPTTTELRWRARTTIDVAQAGGGRRLGEGGWSLRAQVVCLGPTRWSPLAESGVTGETGRVGSAPVRVVRTPRGRLSLRVGKAGVPGRLRRMAGQIARGERAR